MSNLTFFVAEFAPGHEAAAEAERPAAAPLQYGNISGTM
jgi:hypothetical protein